VDKLTIRGDMMKTGDFITIYAASKQWGISEGFFVVLKSFPKYASWFKGDSLRYGEDLVLVSSSTRIKELYTETVQQFNDYDRDPQYINIGNLIKGVIQTSTEIKGMIDSDKYNHLYVKILRRKKVDAVFGPYIYFFKHEFLEKCEYLTTSFIVKALRKRGIQVSTSTILGLKNKGELTSNVNQYGLDTLSLNEAEILVIKSKKEKATVSAKTQYKNSNFNQLNKFQRQMIEDYLSFRAKGGRISHNNFKPKLHIANKEDTFQFLKSGLSTFFFRIICDRCGIKQMQKMRYSSLTQKEKDLYNPDVFNPLEIEMSDAFAFTSILKTTSAVGVYQSIKPFFAWILQKKKAEASTPEKWFEYGQLDRRIEAFLNQFPMNYNEHPSGEEIMHKNKAFLTREQGIMVKMKLLNDPFAKDPFKDATIWELCFVSGLRPYEAKKLRIEYFMLDNKGFLDLNHRGWGVLRLPKEASKQERTPSHSTFGTPIPPGTVKQVNEYLKRLYRKQRNEPVGIGFMFRPDDLFPEKGYKSSLFGDRMRFKEHLDFLTLDQRKDFELKAARRSMNNLIDGYTVEFPDQRLKGRIQKVAADLQMRHKIAKDVGEESYTAPIPEEDYYAVLNCTINFPWNLNELLEWEKKVMQGHQAGVLNSGLKQNPLNDENRSIEDLVKLVDESPRLIEVKKQFNKLRKRPKGLTVEEWLKKREVLVSEMKSISNGAGH
jgi:integrase